jgi:hypothetical protein
MPSLPWAISLSPRTLTRRLICHPLTAAPAVEDS